jgi:hypothetical protein
VEVGTWIVKFEVFNPDHLTCLFNTLTTNKDDSIPSPSRISHCPLSLRERVGERE